MKKVTLVFPDVTSIAEFLLKYKVSKAIVDSQEKTLKGILSEKDLKTACLEYKARIKEAITVRDF